MEQPEIEQPLTTQERVRKRTEEFRNTLEKLDVAPGLPIPTQELHPLKHSTEPRLLIKQIICTSFKSFYEPTTLGPFHKSFTCIIGANGNGKSNVIDAILFVFGFAARKIRSKKLSALVHNSSEHPSSEDSRCRVDIHFATIIDTGLGSTEYEVTPGSEFVISREFWLSNESSHYYLNGCSVNVKQIGDELRKHKVDLDHNRFLILQGEVEQIALMKPKAQTAHEEGLIDYLEDIIGTHRYVPVLKTLMERIEELTERCSESKNRTSVAKAELRRLEPAKTAAVRYLLLENLLTQRKNLSWQCEQNRLREENAELTESVGQIEASIAEATATLEQRTADLDQKNEAIKNEELEKKQLIDQSKKANERYAEIERKDGQMRNEMAQQKKSKEELTKRIGEAEKKLDTQRSKPDQLKAEMEEIDDALPALRQKKAELEEKLQQTVESMKEQTEPLAEKRDKIETEKTAADVKFNEARSRLGVAESKLKAATSAQDRDNQRLEELLENLRLSTEKLQRSQNDVSELEREIPKLETKRTECSRTIEELSERERQLEVRLRKVREKRLEHRERVDASRAGGHLLGRLLNEQRAGRLRGILGRLGDLGGIDPKFDTAVSTASGMLDYIVVENSEAGKGAVAFLKRENAGFGRFADLDRITSQVENRMNRPFSLDLKKVAAEVRSKLRLSTMPDIRRLFDEIRYGDNDEFIRYRPAFYQALGDTLVVENIEIARQVAFNHGRWRVVTLDGKLIETSGAMSGGGRPLKGRMGSKPNRNLAPRDLNATSGLGLDNLKELEEQEKQLKAELTTAGEERQLKQEQTHHTGQELQRKRTQLHRSKNIVEGEKTRMETAKKQVADLRKRMERYQAEDQQLDAMRTEVDAAKKLVDKAEAASKKLSDQVSQVNDEIQRLIDTKAGPVRVELERTMKSLDEMQGRRVKAGSQMKTIEREIVKLERKLANDRRDLEAAVKTLSELKPQFKQNETEAIQLLSERDTFKKRLDEIQKLIDGYKANFAELETSVHDGRRALQRLQHQLEPKKQMLDDVEKKISHIGRKLGELVLHPVKAHLSADDAAKFLQSFQNDYEVGEQQSAEEMEEQSEDGARLVVEGHRLTDDQLDKNIPVDQLKQVNMQSLRKKIEALQSELDETEPNMPAIKDYENQKAIYDERTVEFRAMANILTEQKQADEELRRRRRADFMAAFEFDSWSCWPDLDI